MLKVFHTINGVVIKHFDIYFKVELKFTLGFAIIGGLLITVMILSTKNILKARVSEKSIDEIIKDSKKITSKHTKMKELLEEFTVFPNNSKNQFLF